MLSRAKVLNACGLNRSVLYQNTKIASRLMQIESDLARLGVIKINAVTISATDVDDAFLIPELERSVDVLTEEVSQFSFELEAVQKVLCKYPLPG